MSTISERAAIAEANQTRFARLRKYPGRILSRGITPNGEEFVIQYAITARSAPSQNRKLEHNHTTSSIRTTLADPKGPGSSDTRLTVYPAVAEYDNFHVVSNGTHTLKILGGEIVGMSPIESLASESYEPDSLHTPRIWGTCTLEDGTAKVQIGSINKKVDNDDSLPQNWEYTELVPGLCYTIHTYEGDCDPPQPFYAEPYEMPIESNAPPEILRSLWEIIGTEFRVCALVRTINLKTGQVSTYIENRFS